MNITNGLISGEAPFPKSHITLNFISQLPLESFKQFIQKNPAFLFLPIEDTSNDEGDSLLQMLIRQKNIEHVLAILELIKELGAQEQKEILSYRNRKNETPLCLFTNLMDVIRERDVYEKLKELSFSCNHPDISSIVQQSLARQQPINSNCSLYIWLTPVKMIEMLTMPYDSFEAMILRTPECLMYRCKLESSHANGELAKNGDTLLHIGARLYKMGPNDAMKLRLQALFQLGMINFMKNGRRFLLALDLRKKTFSDLIELPEFKLHPNILPSPLQTIVYSPEIQQIRQKYFPEKINSLIDISNEAEEAPLNITTDSPKNLKKRGALENPSEAAKGKRRHTLPGQVNGVPPSFLNLIPPKVSPQIPRYQITPMQAIRPNPPTRTQVSRPPINLTHNRGPRLQGPHYPIPSSRSTGATSPHTPFVQNTISYNSFRGPIPSRNTSVLQPVDGSDLHKNLQPSAQRPSEYPMLSFPTPPSGSPNSPFNTSTMQICYSKRSNSVYYSNNHRKDQISQDLLSQYKGIIDHTLDIILDSKEDIGQKKEMAKVILDKIHRKHKDCLQPILCPLIPYPLTIEMLVCYQARNRLFLSGDIVHSIIKNKSREFFPTIRSCLKDLSIAERGDILFSILEGKTTIDLLREYGFESDIKSFLEIEETPNMTGNQMRESSSMDISKTPLITDSQMLHYEKIIEKVVNLVINTPKTEFCRNLPKDHPNRLKFYRNIMRKLIEDCRKENLFKRIMINHFVPIIKAVPEKVLCDPSTLKAPWGIDGRKFTIMHLAIFSHAPENVSSVLEALKKLDREEQKLFMEKEDFKKRKAIDLLESHDIGEAAEPLVAFYNSLKSDSPEIDMLNGIPSLGPSSFVSLNLLDSEIRKEKEKEKGLGP